MINELIESFFEGLISFIGLASSILTNQEDYDDLIEPK
jgi:hypothetical protein